MEKFKRKILQFTTTATVFTGKLCNDPLLAYALCIEALTYTFIRGSSHFKRGFLTKIETTNPTDTKILLTDIYCYDLLLLFLSATNDP
jgi:hypothetical protein